ncbi:MAG: hypothetical protein RL065_1612 [Bacteroidota bacterium]|jgi:hypothetical protein
MKNDNEIFKSLIAKGLIGSALGILITTKKRSIALGTLAGETILAAFKANANALKTDIPVIIEENDSLIEINAKGEKKFIKHILKSNHHIPKKFKLEY